MPVLKDLVPGSKSDRLSFHSDNFSLSEDQQHESMEEGTVPTRPSRGFTPSQHVEPKRTTPSNRLGDPAQVRSKVEQKSGTENGKEERQERPSWFTAIISLFSTIVNYLWSKGKRIFKEEAGILELLNDPFARTRVVSKKGKINTHRDSYNRGFKVILKDLFISSIHLSWSWTIFNFFASFVCSWAFFAVIWYLIAWVHGDLDPADQRAEDHVVCVENVEDFTTSFLFSLETQHTIG